MKIVIIKRHLLLLCLYIKYIIILGIYYDCVYIYGTICLLPTIVQTQYIIYVKKNIMCQSSNEMFNYRIKFKFNLKIYIKIMRYKIVIVAYVAQYYEVNQKVKKVLVLHYSIDIDYLFK